MGVTRKLIQWKMKLWTCKTSYRQTAILCCVSVLTLYIIVHYFHEIPNPLKHNGKGRHGSSQEQTGLLHKYGLKKKKHKLCEIFSLKHKSKWMSPQSASQAGCQRIPPLSDSCSVADELFFSDAPATCLHQPSFNFCQLQKSSTRKWIVLCNETASKACISPMSVGMIDKVSGALTWVETGTAQQVAKKLTDAVQDTNTEHHRNFGFCFIRCLVETPTVRSDTAYYQYMSRYDSEREDHYIDDYRFSSEENYAEQLLVLPPQFKPSTPKRHLTHVNKVNINLILIDSVSRQHFYRSLPKSVAVMETINSNPHSGSAVLDFELVQAVRSRTFESLQTIFAGDIDPSEKPFGTQDIPPKPLNLAALLNKFKDKGYNTLWLEDLCYLWEWGISKDLHFLNKSSSRKETWVNMWKKLSESGLDSVDITLSMCKVLEANGVNDHFHGPDSVCFNGRHQHEYLLEYLLLYQQAMEASRESYFTFTMTNVAHEDTGRRIQTLDESLSQYLRSVSVLPNTLTVLFSDHGNAYGSFMAATQEARVELFHPFMFVIVPDKAAEMLKSEFMKAFAFNSQRLVSFLDLHLTLNHLIDPGRYIHRVKGPYDVLPNGLFDVISANRTCDDIPRIMPNLCICQNYDTDLGNDTAINLFAYFAVGRLNDEIQRQQMSSSSGGQDKKLQHGKGGLSAFQKCEHLTLVGVQNVRRSYGQDSAQVFKMDLLVQKSQVFFVAVRVQYNPHDRGYHSAVLEMYDRITPFSKFSICADNVDLSMCVCDTENRQENIPAQSFKPDNMNLIPHFESLVQDLYSDGNCVLLVTIKHDSGAVMFAANKCTDKSFTLTVSLEAHDNKIIHFLPSKDLTILPNGMVLIGFVYNEKGSGWKCSINVVCQVLS